jgi:CBS domain containing-hemolysin-like protein
MSEFFTLRVILILMALTLAGGLRALAAAIRGLDPATLALPGHRRPPEDDHRAESGEQEIARGGTPAPPGVPIVKVVERFVRAAQDLDAGALLALVVAALAAAPALGGPIGLTLAMVGGAALAAILLVLLPERLAAGREAALLGRAVPAVILLAKVFHPLAVLQELAAAALAAIAGAPEPAAGNPAPAASPADPAASGFKRVLAFHRATVDEVMTPRAEIAAIETGATIADLVQVVRTTRRGSYPIYRSTLDELVGWVGLADLLGVMDDAALVDRFSRQVVVVPQSKRVFELALEMRATGMTMVLVVDEFGTVKGLANFHDLIGGLVGEIGEDDERSEFEFRRLDPHTWVFNPQIRIERVNELTGLAIPEGDYQTLAGFILSRMRRIPLPHERLRWREDEFEILAADSRRIRSVRLDRRPPLMVRRVRRPPSLPANAGTTDLPASD